MLSHDNCKLILFKDKYKNYVRRGSCDDFFDSSSGMISYIYTVPFNNKIISIGEIQEYLSMLASLGLNSKLMKKEFKVTRSDIELDTNWLIHSVISMFLKKVFSYKSEGVSTNLDIYIENRSFRYRLTPRLGSVRSLSLVYKLMAIYMAKINIIKIPLVTPLKGQSFKKTENDYINLYVKNTFKSKYHALFFIQAFRYIQRHPTKVKEMLSIRSQYPELSSWDIFFVAHQYSKMPLNWNVYYDCFETNRLSKYTTLEGFFKAMQDSGTISFGLERTDKNLVIDVRNLNTKKIGDPKAHLAKGDHITYLGRTTDKIINSKKYIVQGFTKKFFKIINEANKLVFISRKFFNNDKIS